MSGTNEQACPECGAPRAPDGSPTCACTRRTADALRDTRTAEAAAAEDFDPLRIRPYVGLTPEGKTPAGTRGEKPDGPASPASAEAPTSAGAVAPEAGTGAGAGAGTETGVGTGTGTAPAGDEALTGTQPLEIGGTQPLEIGTTVGVGTTAGSGGSGGSDTPRTPAARRTVVLAAGGAVVAILTATALATGLFSYGKPERNDALPDEVRPSVPAGSATPTATGPTNTSSAATGTGSASPSDTASATATASGRHTATSSPRPTGTRTAKEAQVTSEATRSEAPAPGDEPDQDPPVLRPGDDGPEVEELQRRLRQRLFYLGTADGTYDDDVEAAVSTYQTARNITGDPKGVYGKATRAALEAETDEP